MLNEDRNTSLRVVVESSGATRITVSTHVRLTKLAHMQRLLYNISNKYRDSAQCSQHPA